MDFARDEIRALAAVLTEAGEAVEGALEVSVLSGGRSNLTYTVTDGTHRWILRTPPRSGRTPSAHDIGREFRVTQALAGTAVPVARQVVSVEDASVLGVPFTVADFVEGTAVRTQNHLNAISDERLAMVVKGMLTALASLHRVDPAAVGLAEFARNGGYAERQLKRWAGQWDIVGTAENDEAAQRLINALGSTLPEQRFSRVVHGDFRIDNTLIDLRSRHRPRMSAVVDWELSTLGDPVADVAMMCAYRDPAFDLIVGEPSAWTSHRLPSVQQLANKYFDAGGIELENWEFHLSLAYFKIAVIAAGIDHRRRAGSGGGPGFDTAGHAVAPFFELALVALDLARS